MKKLIIFCALFATARPLAAQTACESWLPMKKGAGYEMQTFTGKDKLTGSIRYTVLDIKQNGNREIASIQAEIHDAKKAEIMSSYDYQVECDGDNMYIDMSAYFNPQQFQAYKDMDVSLDAEDFVLPSDMQVGTEFKDARATAIVSNEGTKFATMTIVSSDKKVTGQETVSVPAGTFNCMKIEGNFLSEIKTLGIPIKINLRSIEWYSKGAGLVRSESYSKKGKLLGYTVLSERF